MVAAVVGEAEMVESAMDLQGQSVTWPHRLLPLALLVVPAHFVFSGEPLSRKAVFFLISGETFSRGS
uniref:Uncharacterized protein n=1 Tax=Oryza rufipogon TaxID=4529 RepID=A0A0E0Q1I0_ORYRU